MTLSDYHLRKLNEYGFRRWTRDDMDRMYISAADLGFDYLESSSGEIELARFQGRDVGHRVARRMHEAKTFLDLNTMTVHSPFPDLARQAAWRVAYVTKGKWDPSAWDTEIRITLPKGP